MNEQEDWPPRPELSQHHRYEQTLHDSGGSQTQNPSWELDLGIRWFSRAGIVALLIGCAMALNYSWGYVYTPLIPEIKILISAVFALALFWGGSRLLERFQLLGRILQGGGLALGYLSLFGMFFIPAVQIFHDPGLQSVGWGLLLLYVGFMIGLSQKMDSRSVAVLSLGFGYYTASYAGTQMISFMASFILSVASVILGNHKQGWKLLPKVGFAGFVFSYLLWQGGWMILEPHVLHVMPTHLFSKNIDETFYLISHFLLFHLSGFGGRLNSETQHSWSNTAFCAANSLLSYILLVSTQNGVLFGWKGSAEALLCLVHLGTYGALLKVSANSPSLKSQANLLLALLYFLLTIFAWMDATMQPVAIAAGALVLGLSGCERADHPLYRMMAGFLLLLACITLLTFNWSDTPAVLLLWTVGSVSLAGLILESFVLGERCEGLGGAMLAISSFLFLLAIMVSLQNQWVTLATVLTGFAFLLAGFALAQPKYRWSGLAWMFLALCRLVTVDILMLAMPYKILLFLAVGALLLAASYGYNRLARTLGKSGQETGLSPFNPAESVKGVEGQPVLPHTHHKPEEV